MPQRSGLEIFIDSLVCLHLFCSLLQIVWLVSILHKGSDRANHGNKPHPLHRIDRYNVVKTQAKFFKYYVFMFFTVLYHISADIYRLVHPYDLSDSSQINIKYVIMYVISYSMRLSDRFITYPTAYEICFQVLEEKTGNFNVLNIGNGIDVLKYVLCFTLKAMPTILMILVNASTYIFADFECTNYFVCLYSWDHWFQASVFLGLAFVFFTEYFAISHWIHLFILAFLLATPIFIMCLPFLFLPIIIPITLNLTFYYELLNATLGIQRLNACFSPSTVISDQVSPVASLK